MFVVWCGSPRETVDDARLSAEAATDELNDVLIHLLWLLWNHCVLQVGAVEALCEPGREDS